MAPDMDGKTKKYLGCRLPRLVLEGKLSSARRLMEKYPEFQDSPLLFVHRITVAESSGDPKRVGELMVELRNVLKDAPQEDVLYFFQQLFAFYLARGRYDKAGETLTTGTGYRVTAGD